MVTVYKKEEGLSRRDLLKRGGDSHRHRLGGAKPAKFMGP